MGLLGNGDAKGDLRLANDSVKFHRLHNVRMGLQEDSVVFMNKSTMLKHFFKLHVKARRGRPLEMPYKLKGNFILEYILYWRSFHQEMVHQPLIC